MVVWFSTRGVAVLFACLSSPVMAADHPYEDDALDVTFHCDTHSGRAVALEMLIRPQATAGDRYPPDHNVRIEAGAITVTAH